MDKKGVVFGVVRCFELCSFIMPCDLEAEAKKKFKVPKTPSSDNYSPDSLERAEAEFQEARKVVLAVRQKWIAEEEAKEAEKEAERVRKKENEVRWAKAREAASNASKVLAENPEACQRCAVDGEYQILLFQFVGCWAG